MKQPFTQKEIHETIYLPTNNKNTGKDRIITAASLKNSPYIAHSMIREIQSETTAAGNGLVGLILGRLNVVQKSIYLFFHFSFLDTVSSDTLIIEHNLKLHNFITL